MDITLNINSTPAHYVTGLGGSVMNDDGSFQKLSAAAKQAVADMIWGASPKGLDATILRLWWNPTESFSVMAAKYITSGVIACAIKAGCTTILLAPNTPPPQYGSGGYFTDAGVQSYAKDISACVAYFKQAGVTIHATGIMNEPNDRPIKFTAAQWPAVVKATRAALDAAGCPLTAIVAPETANCDDVSDGIVKAITADPAAFAALGRFGTHTYNMGADAKRTVLMNGVEYWTTETSENGKEGIGDAYRAATAAAKYISDLNNGVSAWIWFLAFASTDPSDQATRLISYDVLQANGGIQPLWKYWYVQMISQAFPTGTRMRSVTSSIEGTMPFTYGMKPAVFAAAGVRLDGRMSIAVCNYTGDWISWCKAQSSDPTWDLGQCGKQAATYTATINVAELATTKDRRFAVRRSNATVGNVPVGFVTARNGVIKLTINPLEAVTLTAL